MHNICKILQFLLDANGKKIEEADTLFPVPYPRHPPWAWAGLTPGLCISLSHRCCNSPGAQQLHEETSQVVLESCPALWLESCLFTGLAQLPMDKNKGKSNCSIFSPRLTGASAQAVLQAWQALLTLSVSAALSSVQTSASEASFVPRCLTCILTLFQSWIHPKNLELLDGTGLGKIKGRYITLWWGDNYNHQVLSLENKVRRNNYRLCEFLLNCEIMEVARPGKMKAFLLTKAWK